MFKSILKQFGVDSTSSIPKITPNEAFKKMSNNEAILIDVREPDEWASTGSPKGCKQIALQNPDLVSEILSAAGGDKNVPILLCCKAGMRGEKAGQLLMASGVSNIKNVEGGVLQWISEGLPIE